jgi:hypothetical protein
MTSEISDYTKFMNTVEALPPGETITYWRGATLKDPSNPCPEWLRSTTYGLTREKVKTQRVRGKGQSIYMEAPKFRIFQRRNGPFDFSYLIQRI